MTGSAPRDPARWRDTETRERESIRKLRCAVSITTLSVWVPKKSCRTVRSAGSRPDLDGMRDQLLAVAAARLQPQRAARRTHRAFVGVGRDVTDVVDHARPVSFSGRLALGAVRKIMRGRWRRRASSRSCSSANSVLTSSVAASAVVSVACSATASRCGRSIRPCSFRLGRRRCDRSAPRPGTRPSADCRDRAPRDRAPAPAPGRPDSASDR